MYRIRPAAAVLAMGTLVLMGAGCTNWKVKYDTCNAKLENLEALLGAAQDSTDQCRQNETALSEQLAAARQQIQDLRGRTASAQAAPSRGAAGDQPCTRVLTRLETAGLFNPGSVALKADAKTKLRQVAQTIKRQYPGKEVWVIGYTDTDPIRKTKTKWKDNWELSTERALAVTRYLIEQGVSAEHVTAAGRGQFHPLSSKAASRRVEIIVQMDQ